MCSFSISSSCEPSSIIVPLLITYILSAFFIVDNLFAITITVLFFSKSLIFSNIILCDILSNADVASSNIIILELLISALAMPTLCFCPPDNLTPFSPIIVLNPLGSSFIKLCISTFLHTASTNSLFIVIGSSNILNMMLN